MSHDEIYIYIHKVVLLYHPSRRSPSFIHLVNCKIPLIQTYFTKCKLKATSSVKGKQGANALRSKKRGAEANERKEENKDDESNFFAM